MAARDSIRPHLALLLAGLLSVVPTLAWTQAPVQDLVTWMVLDVPPSVILRGPYEGTGNVDKIRQVFVSSLPELRHEVEVNNIERVSKELKGTRQVLCASLVVTPDRQRDFLLSIPEALIPANMVILRKTDQARFAPYLNTAGEVDLELLVNSPLVIGVAIGRRYSGPVDALIQANAGKANLFARAATNVSEGLVTMLQNQRLDCSLLFPFEAQYLARQSGLPVELVSLPIQGMPPYSVVAAAAPRTPWGEKMIEKLNAVIRANRQTTFIEALVPWLDPQAEARYRKDAAAYFSKVP